MNYGKEPSAINLPVFPKSKSANIRETPSTGAKIIFVATAANSPGKLSGNYLIDGAYRWYQVLMTGGGYGYVRNDVVNLSAHSSVNNDPAPQKKPQVKAPDSNQDKKQTLLKNVLESDQAIYKRILVLSEALERCKSQGIKLPSYTIPLSSVTIAPNKMLELIIKRYNDRQKEIQQQIIADSYGSAMNKLSPGTGPFQQAFMYLYQKFTGSGVSGLGEVVSAAVYVTAGIIISVALYLLLTKKSSEQKVDLKVSEDLMTALNTLPSDKKEAVLKDLQEQIKDAYKKGQNDSTFGMIKNGLLILGGVILAVKGIPMLLGSSKNNPQL